jgi:SAM-dependent methyltransferase
VTRAYYAEDLAYIHDAGFGGFARGAAPGLARLLKKARARFVVELGCGSGAAAGRLVRSGHDVLGIDASPAMIRLARSRVPRASFAVGRLPKASVPPCDAVVAVGEVLNYMPQASDFDTLFRGVLRSLRPAGIFVFDAKLKSGPSAPVVRGRFADDWAVLAESSEDARGKLARRIVSFRRVGRAWRRSEETHRLTLLAASDLKKRLARAGFSVRVLPGYGAFRVPAGHAVFVARKPR